jgi:hypothetical protein
LTYRPPILIILGRKNPKGKEVVVEMEFGLVIVVGAVVLLDLLARRYGVDTRDGSDWTTRPDGGRCVAGGCR